MFVKYFIMTTLDNCILLCKGNLNALSIYLSIYIKTIKLSLTYSPMIEVRHTCIPWVSTYVNELRLNRISPQAKFVFFLTYTDTKIALLNELINCPWLLFLYFFKPVSVNSKLLSRFFNDNN